MATGQPWASHCTGKGASQACDWSLILSFKPQEGPSRPGQPGSSGTGVTRQGQAAVQTLPWDIHTALTLLGKK